MTEKRLYDEQEHKPKHKKVKVSRNLARRKEERPRYKLTFIYHHQNEQEKNRPVVVVHPLDKSEGWGDSSPELFKKKFEATEQYDNLRQSNGNEINGINALPIVSQLKSAVLYVSGNKEEARQVQADFVTTCPVVSQVTTGVQLYQGDKEGAKQSWSRFCSFMNGAVNSIPIIGHVKGAYHKANGDDDAANEAFLAASRTTGVMAGGIVGIAGGPAGMIAGGIAGGAVVDGVVTGIYSKNGEYRPSGVFAAAKEIKENPTVGGVFDAIAGVVLDGATGLAAGSSVKYTRTKLTRTQLRRFYRKNAAARVRGLPVKARPTYASGFKMGRGASGAGTNGGGKKLKKVEMRRQQAQEN